MKLKQYKIEDGFIVLAVESDYYGSHSDLEGASSLLYKINMKQREFIDSLWGKDFAHGHFSYSDAEQAFVDRIAKYPDDFEVIG